MSRVGRDGGPGADPATIEFLRSRTFPTGQMHAVTYATTAGRQIDAVIRTWQNEDASWVVAPVGGGSGRDPQRSSPWVNFTAGWSARSFFAGGHVIGTGAEPARTVRLTFACGTVIDDVIGHGMVLFWCAPGVELPARVEILDATDRMIASYDEFIEFV
jgi:hypothetical protein